MKYLTTALAFLMTLSTQAGAGNVSCEIKSNFKYADPDDTDQLIIRTNSLNTQAILMSKYHTQVYNCIPAIVDEYECYGFLGKPFEAPTQLNISETKAGSIVVTTTLNLGFLGAYAADNYKASDHITRRFSMDTYIIKSCD